MNSPAVPPMETERKEILFKIHTKNIYMNENIACLLFYIKKVNGCVHKKDGVMSQRFALLLVV